MNNSDIITRLSKALPGNVCLGLKPGATCGNVILEMQTPFTGAMFMTWLYLLKVPPEAAVFSTESYPKERIVMAVIQFQGVDLTPWMTEPALPSES